MNDNKKNISKVLQFMDQSKSNNNLNMILSKLDWPVELFFICLTNEIIKELTKIIHNFESNTIDNDMSYIYKMIKIFNEIQSYKIYFTNEVLECLITKENIQNILSLIITFNNEENLKINNNELNTNLFNFLADILILNINKNIIDEIENLFNDVFKLFSINEQKRKYIYGLEKTIINNKNLNKIIEMINVTLEIIYENLEKENNNFQIIEEIKFVIFLYQKQLNIIDKLIFKLLELLFKKYESKINESQDNNNDLIKEFFKDLFKIVVFDENGFNKELINFLFDLFMNFVNNNENHCYNIFITELLVIIDTNEKYKYLINETNYPTVLNELYKIKNEQLLAFYFSKINILAIYSNDDQFILKNEINFLFNNLCNILESNDENLLNLITSQILNLININIKTINYILNEYNNLYAVFLSIIYSSKYEKKIKLGVISLLENIFILNKNKFLYNIKIPLNLKEIEENNENEVIKELFILSLKYENDKKEFNNKITILLNLITGFIRRKKFEDFIVFIDILLSGIYNNIKENEINDDSIIAINLFLKNVSNILPYNFSHKLICILFAKEFSFNSKLINYKINEKCFEKMKTIISVKTINNIIVNIFQNIKDFDSKKTLLNYILDYCFDNNKNDKKEKNFKNGEDFKFCYLLRSPYIIIKILNIFYYLRDFEIIGYLFEILNEINNYSGINKKLLLLNIDNEKEYSKDLIIIIIKIILDIYDNKTFEKLNQNILNFLNTISKYLSEKLLISFLSEIHQNFLNSIINDTINKGNFAITNKLLKMIYNSILSSEEKITNFISISKCLFTNSYIYNSLNINNLNFKKILSEKYEKSHVFFNIKLRISSYNNLNNFHLLDLYNNNQDICLSIIIIQNTQLIIQEKDYKINHTENLGIIENINNFLVADNNFHDLSIIFDLCNKNLSFQSDKVKFPKDEQKINFRNLNFNEITVGIGFYNEIVNCYNNDNDEDKLFLGKNSIIDISNILIFYFEQESDKNLIINKKENLNINESLQDYVNLNKDKTNIQLMKKLIIADINFDNKKLNIIKHDEVNKEYKNNLINKYIDIKNNKKYLCYFNENNNINVIIISLTNNIEYFYALNLSSSEIIYKLDQLNIEKTIFKNYNTSFSACNYFFIDYLISFLFDIEKYKNKVISNNINEISELIIIIFETIFSLPSKKIVDYFLYDNDLIHNKIRIFFIRNIYLLNNEEFVQKILNIFISTQNTKIYCNNKICLLVLLSDILFDLSIFQNLNNKIRNLAMIYLFQLFKENKSDNIDKYFCDFLFKLINNLFNICLYYVLPKEIINTEINMNCLDIIIKCLANIFEFYINNLKNNSYITRMNTLTNFTLNCFSNFLEDGKNYSNTHELQSFLNNENTKNNICFNDVKNRLNNFEYLISTQLNQLISSLKIFNNNTIKKKKICSFCLYFSFYFKMEFNLIYDNIKYDKYLTKNYRNLFMHNENYKKILGRSNYSWYLSSNENTHKIQNIFFLKENDIEKKGGLVTRAHGEVYEYRYKYDEQKYKSNIQKLYNLFCYDKLSKDISFVTVLFNNNFLNDENNTDNKNLYINCVSIEKVHKNFSLLLIKDDYLVIINNICIDGKNQLNVVKDEVDMTMFCLKYEEYLTYLETFINQNNNNILQEFYEEKNKNDTSILNDSNYEEKETYKKESFGYKKNYNFEIKIIYYDKITEMHKVTFLQIENSIEIFVKNGKSYFICLPMDKRDDIYFNIINKLNDISQKKYKQPIEGFTQIDNNNNYFYMKFCPQNYIENNTQDSNKIFSKTHYQKKSNKLIVNNIFGTLTNFNYYKLKYKQAIINPEKFLKYSRKLWSKNKISNYDYLMLINILANRSLNVLSQYFIFPRILNNFSKSTLNYLNKSIYRDLEYPILSNDEKTRENLQQKYTLLDEDSKYHTGTFYSTYAFVSYYLIRQRPFSEIQLEFQGGEFDSTDRLFIGAKEFCAMLEKYQESIPALMTLPELYMNTNKFNFGFKQENKTLVNDFEFPNWTKKDPRKFILVIKKLLESEKISENLHLWIDLVFGVKQSGEDAIEYCNTYRKACYPFTKEELEKIDKCLLTETLIEKEEMGYMSKKIFTKLHKQKDNFYDEYKENANIFFDDNSKLRNMNFHKIMMNNNLIKLNKVYDLIILNNLNDNAYFQGGIASLRSLMIAFNKETNDDFEIIENDNVLNKNTKFLLMGKNCCFLGGDSEYIITYNKKYLNIINNKNNYYYSYFIDENSDITKIESNSKGKRFYVAFDNGYIFEYTIIQNLENSNYNNSHNIIYPFACSNISSVNHGTLYKNIYINNDIKEYNFRSSISNISYLLLHKNKKNNFIYGNPHIPEKIILLKLNKEHKILIAITITYKIYIISLNNNFKIIHIVDYYQKYEYNYKIKDIIIPNSITGDFIIYSSMNAFLFSINGVPLCDLNLLDKVYDSIKKITTADAEFLNDIVLFTGHEDCSVILWKVKNKNVMEKFDRRMSFIFNKNKSKCFLNEYYYNYDLENENNIDINDCELQRKFEMISKIQIESLSSQNAKIKFMKISYDLSYLTVIDTDNNIYNLSDFGDDVNKTNKKIKSDNHIKKVFKHMRQKSKKFICYNCKKDIIDNYYDIDSIDLDEDDEKNDDFDDKKSDNKTTIKTKNINIRNYKTNTVIYDSKGQHKKGKPSLVSGIKKYICEECRLKLSNIENFLYNY